LFRNTELKIAYKTKNTLRSHLQTKIRAINKHDLCTDVLTEMQRMLTYTGWFRRSYRHLWSTFLKTFWAKSVI
jgi:hypothetical protein